MLQQASRGGQARLILAPRGGMQPPVTRYSSGKCFHSRTAFQRPDLTPVRAAQLRSGDRVLGPSGRVVRVLSVVHQPLSLCDMVILRTATSEFMVTPDHRLTVESSDGEPQDLNACQVLGARESRASRLSVYDGRRFHQLHSIVQKPMRCEVVAVRFENDQRVLAWLPPAGRRRPRNLDRNRALAVRGNPYDVPNPYDGPHLRVRNTFLQFEYDAHVSERRRSRSMPDVRA